MLSAVVRRGASLPQLRYIQKANLVSGPPKNPISLVVSDLKRVVNCHRSDITKCLRDHSQLAEKLELQLLCDLCRKIAHRYIFHVSGESSYDRIYRCWSIRYPPLRLIECEVL